MDFELPVQAARVQLAETGLMTETDADGMYVLNELEPGRYTLFFSKEGYQRTVQSGVPVARGQMAEVDAELSPEYAEMDELVVRDIPLGGAGEIGLLNLRMQSSALMDSVGAELMSRAGASDAAAALKLVSGATVQDGKYAVVRGLPDRYVNSQMNGVRLPTADPDKRAVQLDQFPSTLIESIQVSKTFTPDQQGDASGGAVNVVLKGIPEENILKFKVGTAYKTNLGKNDFISYDGGGVTRWGREDGRRDVQPVGTDWTGAVGVRKKKVPSLYDWEVTAGNKYVFGSGIKVGGSVNFYYKKDATTSDEKTDDKYDRNADLPPTDSTKTALFDVQQSSEEVQWGTLGVLGVESERNQLKLLYMSTHVAEDQATLAEDTRGKAHYFPGYDPDDLNHPGNSTEYIRSAIYKRNQTLEYVERDTETIQLSGEHTLPFPEIEVWRLVKILEPEINWTVSESFSGLISPDKRMFGTEWQPPYLKRGKISPPTYSQSKPESTFVLGNLQRIWKEIEEDSRQTSFNGKLPFEQWSGEEGFIQLGIFSDTVQRTYKQESFSNFNDPIQAYQGGWGDPWSDVFPDEFHAITPANIDVNYDAEQEISAWYYMVDCPISTFFKVIGGVRYEETVMDLVLSPDEPDPAGQGAVYLPDGNGGATPLLPGMADVNFKENDNLPSLGFEFNPIKQIVFRGSYSETIARQTFKELTPIQQSEYLGADIFIGNPDLQMSALKNYDLRFDFKPFADSLVSVSWFHKKITDPIEYTQDYAVNIGEYITSVNYPEGVIFGYEFELRQQLGRFWDSLEGLAIGANATFIDSEVTLSENDKTRLEALGYPEPTRDMLNAPEHLYNFNVTYDIEQSGTKLGLFYTVQGDTLLAGPGMTRFVPSVYAAEYGTLNFSLSQKIWKHCKIDFKVKNILNPEVRTMYRSDYIPEDMDKTSYKKGVDFSISLSGTF